MQSKPDPFLGSAAVRSGLTSRRHLPEDYDRIHRDVYIEKGTEIDAVTRALAAGHWAKGHGVLSGKSAAALHRAQWIASSDPAEIVLKTRTRPPEGIVVRQDSLLPSETCEIVRFAVTTPARTVYDLGRRLPLKEALVVADSLCRATKVTADQVLTVAAAHPRSKNLTQLRRIAELMDGGAQSPPESRLRLLIVESHLPRPETQVPIRAEDGFIVAHADLGWREWKVTAEYDGEDHWTDENQRAWDIDRKVAVHELGWEEIRVSSKHLRLYQHLVIDRIKDALRRRGWRPPH